MKALSVIEGISSELKDKNRREIITFLLETLDRPSSLYRVKREVDALVSYEKGML